MAFTQEFEDGTSPGISAPLLNEPFHITDATSYDGTNDDLNIVVGPGRLDMGEASGGVYEQLSDTTVTISAPAASTTYYVFLQTDGTYRTSTSSARSGDIRLGSVTTASDKTVSSRDDRRGILVPTPGAIDHSTWEVDNSTENGSITSFPTTVSADLTIPSDWGGYKTIVAASYALNGPPSGSGGVYTYNITPNIAGTSEQTLSSTLVESASSDTGHIVPGAVRARRTGMSTTGNVSVGVEFDGVEVTDIHVYSRAVRTS